MFHIFLDGTCGLVVLYLQDNRTIGHRVLRAAQETKSNFIFTFVPSHFDAVMWFHWT